MTQLVTIHTDGATSGNPGPGGWGAVIAFQGGATVEVSGSTDDVITTSPVMELTAAVEALESLPFPGYKVMVISDCTYVVNGAGKWLRGWKKRNWMTSTGTPVANQELWKRMDALCKLHSVKFKWVKGHAGDPNNERADKLASSRVKRKGKRK